MVVESSLQMSCWFSGGQFAICFYLILFACKVLALASKFQLAQNSPIFLGFAEVQTYSRHGPDLLQRTECLQDHKTQQRAQSERSAMASLSQKETTIKNMSSLLASDSERSSVPGRTYNQVKIPGSIWAKQRVTKKKRTWPKRPNCQGLSSSFKSLRVSFAWRTMSVFAFAPEISQSGFVCTYSPFQKALREVKTLYNHYIKDLKRIRNFLEIKNIEAKWTRVGGLAW